MDKASSTSFSCDEMLASTTPDVVFTITPPSATSSSSITCELPGLWNGAMSNWNTIFVEVPIGTFNPVKTVNDLLREQHQ